MTPALLLCYALARPAPLVREAPPAPEALLVTLESDPAPAPGRPGHYRLAYFSYADRAVHTSEADGSTAVRLLGRGYRRVPDLRRDMTARLTRRGHRAVEILVVGTP